MNVDNKMEDKPMLNLGVGIGILGIKEVYCEKKIGADDFFISSPAF